MIPFFWMPTGVDPGERRKREVDRLRRRIANLEREQEFLYRCFMANKNPSVVRMTERELREAWDDRKEYMAFDCQNPEWFKMFVRECREGRGTYRGKKIELVED